MRQSEVFRGPPKQILSGFGGIRSGCDFAVCLCDAALGYGLPPEYGSWLEYIRDLDHLSGTKALPAFYAAEYYLGGAGIWILMASLLALILTSLIGNITALSRLFYALGRDGVLPSSLGELNRHGVPGKAIGLIALLSMILFVSLVWMNQSIIKVTETAADSIETAYTQAGLAEAQTELISRQMAAIRSASARSISVVVLVFALSLSVLLNNYRLMSRQAESSRMELLAVRDMAGRDALTGVKNKLAYTEKERDMERKMLTGEAEDFALAVLDVNGLKHINDTIGHQAGDEYIKKA